MKSHANNQQRTALAAWDDDGGAPCAIGGRPADAVEWQYRLTADGRRILVGSKKGVGLTSPEPCAVHRWSCSCFYEP